MGKDWQSNKKHGSGNSVFSLPWKCDKCLVLASTMANPCDFGPVEMSLTQMQKDK